MWVESLRVQHFGHFSERSLVLGQEPGLTVIDGPNGAGKTTLLNALRSLLFGIPKQTPYSDSGADAASPVISGVLRDRVGNIFRVARHKQNKVLAGKKIEANGKESSLDDETFGACVGLRDRVYCPHSNPDQE